MVRLRISAEVVWLDLCGSIPITRDVPFLEFAPPTGQPPTRDSLERLHRLLVMRRPQMIDIARPAPRARTIWTAVAPDRSRTVRM